MSYFGAGSGCGHRLHKGLPFPPARLSCIAASRQGFPSAQKQAALTAPGRDAGRISDRREWQDPYWQASRQIGHFYFADLPKNRTFLLCSDQKCNSQKCNSQKMQFAGPKDGGLVYTKWDPEVQNGNSG
jgi:hypothetical protein